MATIRLEERGSLSVLRFLKGRGHSLDGEMISDLRAALAGLERGESRGLLLAADHARVFCTGLDLVALWPLDRDALRDLMRDFCSLIQELVAFSRPVVAALRGHAVAGGLMIALGADHRLLCRGAKMGLNELAVGLPMPWTVTRLLEWAVPTRAQASVVLLGRNLEAEEAIAAGLAHELAEPAGFEELCLRRLEEFAAKAPEAGRLTKTWLREPLVASMKAEEARCLELFLDTWFLPETRARMEAVIQKIGGG